MTTTDTSQLHWVGLQPGDTTEEEHPLTERTNDIFVIETRYPGRCKTCGRWIRPGEYVNWYRQLQKIEHPACELSTGA